MAIDHAKSLRKNMTDAERRLWYLLRAHRFGGIKFKRQSLIGRYIVDFVCYEHRLVIEVDGGQHADDEIDRQRAQWLEDQGFRVMRFWNNEVLANTSGVLEMIADAIAGSLKAPSPDTPLRGAPPSPTSRSKSCAGGEGKKRK